MKVCAPAPIDDLAILTTKGAEETFEPIYGGYANGRGEISLSGESQTFRINFKNKTVRERPSLNPEAQARYDAAQPGESFAYCNVNFRRLSHDQIIEICSSGSFRMTPRLA